MLARVGCLAQGGRLRCVTRALPGCDTAAVPDMTRPSVVVSTLDRPLFLSRCLDALLAGTLLPIEVLVVDQGDPGPVRLVLDARQGRGVELLHAVRTDRGLSVSQNAGVERARSEVVCVVDDDCVPDRRWVEVAAREHARAAGPLLLTGRVLPLPADGDRVLPLSSRISTTRRDLAAGSLPWEVGTGGNFSVTRSAYLAVGGNDVRLGTGTLGRAGNDLDLFHRLLRDGIAASYEPDLVVLHERATAAERRRRRWTYGFGAGACIALWRAQDDPAATAVLREWVLMRLRLLKQSQRPAQVVDELRVLLGTVHGLYYGWRLGRR